jgi:hypothetical protein
MRVAQDLIIEAKREILRVQHWTFLDFTVLISIFHLAPPFQSSSPYALFP